MNKQSLTYAFGIFCQAMGWFLVYLALLLVWILKLEVSPFRYMEF